MHAIGAAVENIEHSLPAQPACCGVLRESFEQLVFGRPARALQRIFKLSIRLDNREILPRLMLASKRGFLRIALAQAALHGFLVRRNPAVQHVAFRQIELVYRIFHGKAHGAMVLGAQVVRLEKSPVPFRGRVNGVEMHLDEALPRETARASKQREIHFRIVVEPIFRSARRAVDSLLGDSARMLEALLQQRVRIRQAAPRGALLPKSALLPALGADGRPMSATASFGVVSSGNVDSNAFVGAFTSVGARNHIIGGDCICRGDCSGAFVGIATFVVAMALVGAMFVFGKLVLRHDSTFPRGPFYPYCPL